MTIFDTATLTHRGTSLATLPYRKSGDFLEGIVALPDRPIMGLLEVR